MRVTSFGLWESWSGRGEHEGHVVTAIEQWPLRVDINATTQTAYIDNGRVRCSCGEEWNTVAIGQVGWHF